MPKIIKKRTWFGNLTQTIISSPHTACLLQYLCVTPSWKLLLYSYTAVVTVIYLTNYYATLQKEIYIQTAWNEQLKASVKEPNMFHNYETEKITRKASDATEYIELFGSSARSRSSCTTHLMLFSERPPWKNRTTRYYCRFSAASLALQVIFVRRKRPPIYALCMKISGWKNRTTHCSRFWRAGCSRLEYIDIRSVY